jgi:hypothetical protein
MVYSSAQMIMEKDDLLYIQDYICNIVSEELVKNCGFPHLAKALKSVQIYLHRLSL